MTSRTFRASTLYTCTTLIAAISLLIFCDIRYGINQEYFRALSTSFLGIAAAWLAFCWQRRVAFTKALFEVWQKTVATVQDAIAYTMDPDPKERDFLKIQRDLSCRIDDVRGVFRNVAETRLEPTSAEISFVRCIFHLPATQADFIKGGGIALKEYRSTSRFEERAKLIGFYPFESLKQIHKTFVQVGYGEHCTAAQRADIRQLIVALWNILRDQFLKELDRDYPEHPDTPFYEQVEHPVVMGMRLLRDGG